MSELLNSVPPFPRYASFLQHKFTLSESPEQHTHIAKKKNQSGMGNVLFLNISDLK
jgi:hypothetical protein